MEIELRDYFHVDFKIQGDSLIERKRVDPDLELRSDSKFSIYFLCDLGQDV